MVKKAAQAKPNNLLRMARKERGWTQKDVADRIKAPLALNVTRWEGGTAFPSPHYVEQLCLLFGKSARELGLIEEEFLHAVEQEEQVNNSKEPSFPLPQPTASVFPFPKIVPIIGLVLLIVIAGSGLIYIFYRGAFHVPSSSKRSISAVTPDVNKTATTTTYPDPYPPYRGKLAFYDPLSEPYLWGKEANSSFGSTCQFIQGAYHITEEAAARAGTCFNSSFDAGNLTIEVQMKISQGDCGGIIVRSNEPEDYQFTVCHDGYYSFTRYQNSTAPKILVNKISPAITIGFNRFNVLAIVADGNRFDLYVNKHKIDSIQDSSYSHGQVGLIAECDTSSFTEVIYSQAKIWTL